MSQTIYDPISTIVYNPEAIQKMVALALTEIPGILTADKNLLAKVSNRFFSNSDYQGISVQIRDQKISLNIAVVCEYGRSIPLLLKESRDLITKAIKEMTDLVMVEYSFNVISVLTTDEFEEHLSKSVVNKTVVTNKRESIAKAEGYNMSDYKTVTKQVVDKAKEVSSNVVDKAKEVGSEVVDKAKEVGGEVVDKAKEVANETADKAQELGEKTVEKGHEVADKAKEVGSDIVDKTKDFGSEVADKVKEVSGEALDKTKEVANKTADKAQELGEKTVEKVKDTTK